MVKFKNQQAEIVWERAGEASIVIKSGKDQGRQMIVESSELDRSDLNQELAGMSDEELLKLATKQRGQRVKSRAQSLAKEMAKRRKIKTERKRDPYDRGMPIPQSMIDQINASGDEKAIANMKAKIRDGQWKPVYE